MVPVSSSLHAYPRGQSVWGAPTVCSLQRLQRSEEPRDSLLDFVRRRLQNPCRHFGASGNSRARRLVVPDCLFFHSRESNAGGREADSRPGGRSSASLHKQRRPLRPPVSHQHRHHERVQELKERLGGDVITSLGFVLCLLGSPLGNVDFHVPKTEPQGPFQTKSSFQKQTLNATIANEAIRLRGFAALHVLDPLGMSVASS